jgi:hypothetical protein
MTPRPSGQGIDLTHNIASNDELRRRAAEGDQRAIAELARRSVAQEGRAA